ncbi:MAG: hypothetical protein ACTS6P_01835 [Candidatus Hodgkinia cicadicola]
MFKSKMGASCNLRIVNVNIGWAQLAEIWLSGMFMFVTLSGKPVNLCISEDVNLREGFPTWFNVWLRDVNVWKFLF